MALIHRHRLTIIVLVLYWLVLFTSTHVPIPPIPSWAVAPALSDKILHFTAFLVLMFFFWFAINPDQKVNWRKAAVWWILFIVVSYGALDEWTQGFVGRTTDVKDFAFDFAGAFTGLILLTFFPFWPAALTLTAVSIFVLTGFTQSSLAYSNPAANAAFHAAAYATFTILWIKCLNSVVPVRPPQIKWLIGVILLPIFYLYGVGIFSNISGDGFTGGELLAAICSILIVSLAAFLPAYIRMLLDRRRRRNIS